MSGLRTIRGSRNTMQNVVLPADLDARKSGSFKIGGEIEIHRLGFGAMRVTGPGIWGPPVDRAEAIHTLKRVSELGIDFIDTADSYGPDAPLRGDARVARVNRS